MSEFSITISIVDRQYKLTIEKNEEEIVRKAAKSIEETIKSYSRLYAFKDSQDLLAMVALQNTTSYLRSEDRKADTDESLLSKLIEMNEIVAKNL